MYFFIKYYIKYHLIFFVPVVIEAVQVSNHCECVGEDEAPFVSISPPLTPGAITLSGVCGEL